MNVNKDVVHQALLEHQPTEMRDADAANAEARATVNNIPALLREHLKVGQRRSFRIRVWSGSGGVKYDSEVLGKTKSMLYDDGIVYTEAENADGTKFLYVSESALRTWASRSGS